MSEDVLGRMRRQTCCDGAHRRRRSADRVRPLVRAKSPTWRSRDCTLSPVQRRFVQLRQRLREPPERRVDVPGCQSRTPRQPLHDHSGPAEPDRLQISNDRLRHPQHDPLGELETTPLQRCRTVTVTQELHNHLGVATYRALRRRHRSPRLPPTHATRRHTCVRQPLGPTPSTPSAPAPLGPQYRPPTTWLFSRDTGSPVRFRRQPRRSPEVPYCDGRGERAAYPALGDRCEDGRRSRTRPIRRARL